MNYISDAIEKLRSRMVAVFRGEVSFGKILGAVVVLTIIYGFVSFVVWIVNAYLNGV